MFSKHTCVLVSGTVFSKYVCPCVLTSSSGEDDSGNILVTVPWGLSHGLLIPSSNAIATAPVTTTTLPLYTQPSTSSKECVHLSLGLHQI